MRRCVVATPRAAPPRRPSRSSARRTHPAIRARWWRSRCGTANSASPARCRRGSPSPLRDRPRRWPLLLRPQASRSTALVILYSSRRSTPFGSAKMQVVIARTNSTMAARGASSPSHVLRHDQVLPFVDPPDLARTDHGRAVELREDRRSRKARAHVELFALIDRAVELRAIEARALHAPPRIRQCCAGAREFRRLDRRHEADAAHAIGYGLDRLLRRHMAKHTPVLMIEADAQFVQVGGPQRLGPAGDGDLV